MKASFESVNASANSSFIVRKFNEKKFSAPYHFHPEYELTYILTGSGKRYVGDTMNDYVAGDLVLLGANLPHCWKTEDTAITRSVSVVIHFKKDFLGENLFDKPEMKGALRLLNDSNYGLQFTGDNEDVKRQILSLFQEKDSFKKLVIFLEVLYKLCSNKNYAVLDKQNSYSGLSENDKQRINEVIAYIVENFQNRVSLKKAASTANMTTHAFCKYFKKTTRKTFMEAVNDYRIDFATKQLINTDKPVAEIGLDSGFNDVSNFHKMFKRKIKHSPLSYRNIYLRRVSE